MYSFSAAHRLEEHPKCGRLHGHNYRLEVTLFGEVSRLTGMVTDFATLDRIVQPIVDTVDHHYLVSRDNIAHDDPYWINARHGDCSLMEIYATTAELMAGWFVKKIRERLPEDKRHLVVRLWENDRSYAEAR